MHAVCRDFAHDRSPPHFRRDLPAVAGRALPCGEVRSSTLAAPFPPDIQTQIWLHLCWVEQMRIGVHPSRISRLDRRRKSSACSLFARSAFCSFARGRLSFTPTLLQYSGSGSVPPSLFSSSCPHHIMWKFDGKEHGHAQHDDLECHQAYRGSIPFNRILSCYFATGTSTSRFDEQIIFIDSLTFGKALCRANGIFVCGGRSLLCRLFAAARCILPA